MKPLCDRCLLPHPQGCLLVFCLQKSYCGKTQLWGCMTYRELQDPLCTLQAGSFYNDCWCFQCKTFRRLSCIMRECHYYAHCRVIIVCWTGRVGFQLVGCSNWIKETTSLDSDHFFSPLKSHFSNLKHHFLICRMLHWEGEHQLTADTRRLVLCLAAAVTVELLNSTFVLLLSLLST